MTAEITDDGSHREKRREQLILLILAAVQFTTIVDFMIVMPLGPQLMRKLGVDPAQFDLIVASYTLAAGTAGLIASSLVDRFARRTTFMIFYAGFLVGTLLCGLAPNYPTLVAARVATGAFGGILGGMSMAIIGDVFPEQRRGSATGSLMTGFALASVAGVPLGLFVGTNYGWHIPFIALAIVGLPALVLTPFAMPPLNAHVGKVHAHPLRSLFEIASDVNHLNAFALIVMLMIGSFTVFPLLSVYLVNNVGMTEDQLPWVYVAGGALTLISAPIIGRLADRYGKLNVYCMIAPGSALMLLVITHLPPVPVTVAVAVFGGLMMCNVGRMIAAMAMVTSSVEPRGAARFLVRIHRCNTWLAASERTLAALLSRNLPTGKLHTSARSAGLPPLARSPACGSPVEFASQTPGSPQQRRSASPPPRRQRSMPANRCSASTI